MVNINRFKQEVKKWVQKNPQASEAEFLDFCEDMIPSVEYTSSKWLIEQALCWFKFVQKMQTKS